MNLMGSGQIAEACFFFSGLCADSQATWRAQGKGRTPLWHAPCQARPSMLQSLPSFFSNFFFLENCLLVPQSSQSTAASSSTTAFQTFPFYSPPWSITNSHTRALLQTCTEDVSDPPCFHCSGWVPRTYRKGLSKEIGKVSLHPGSPWHEQHEEQYFNSSVCGNPKSSWIS